jgi:hypothetical protein
MTFAAGLPIWSSMKVGFHQTIVILLEDQRQIGWYHVLPSGAVSGLAICLHSTHLVTL